MTSILTTRSYAAVRPLVTASMRRTIATTTPRMGMKESSGHNPDYERHKQDLLSKHKQGKGHWKPELASNSEESVKADRSEPLDSSAESIKKLQERTKKATEETDKHGTSMSDGL
ncbi:hypothetical protein NKR23_g10643 [Pleurostoma richardsiae]|uniref:Mitochondrial carrier protein pet8 n=1 Tax=Pleurostoma richardsiae TaxID=41990 RepID=A0AA38R4T5_9PEZI|nr:hypothetical protein NKR23_g10643 [Pleurostoma richardsiae]